MIVEPADVSRGLQQVRERLAAACARAGRAPEEVRLVAVTKRIPLDLVAAACRAGQWDLGENRVQEALERQPQLADLLVREGLDPSLVRWHFIGHLQRNKARRASGRFALLHGVESPELAERLSNLAQQEGRTEDILLEVNISGEAQKYGLQPARTLPLAERVMALPGLHLIGLMGMARYGAPEPELREAFAGLRRLAEEVRRTTGLPLPQLSMGMSADFEAAVLEGATIVRVGTAIFGSRSER